MKLRTLSTLLVAATLSLPVLVLAQAHDDGHDDHGAPAQGHDNKPEAHKEAPGGGAGPNHQFHKGDRLSTDYRNKRYVVSDWKGHHLSAPPRGYHWVQTGNDYVLAAIATGVIADILVNQ